MKTKNSIQIVETPIIDKFDFHENNGVINPAFLATPDTGRNIGDDYRVNHFHSRPNQNGLESIASSSSWVYEFNNGSQRNNTSDSMATTSTTATHIMPTYGRYNGQHLSCEMDLNHDHHKHRNGSACCLSCPTLLRLFIWTIIIVSLLGIVFSVAFIVYIEKFAIESCCGDHNNSIGSHNSNTTVHILKGLSNNSTEYSVPTSAVLKEKTGLTLSTDQSTDSPLLNSTSIENQFTTASAVDITTNTPIIDNRTTAQPKEPTTQSTDHLIHNSTVNEFDPRVLFPNNMTEPQVLVDNISSTTVAINSIIDSNQTTGHSSNSTTTASSISNPIITTTIEPIPITATEISIDVLPNTADNNSSSAEVSSLSSSIVKPTEPSSATTPNNLSDNESNYTTNANTIQSKDIINHSSTQVLNATAVDNIDNDSTDSTFPNAIPKEEELSIIITNTTTPFTSENKFNSTDNPSED